MALVLFEPQAEATHEARHPFFVKDCRTCRWHKLGDGWVPQLTYHHPQDPAKQIASIAARVQLGGDSNLGCPSYERAGSQCVWGRFAADDLSMFQLNNLRKHHTSTGHLKAVADYFQIDFNDFRNYV